MYIKRLSQGIPSHCQCDKKQLLITTEQLFELYIELKVRKFAFMTIIHKVYSFCHRSAFSWASGRTFPELLWERLWLLLTGEKEEKMDRWDRGDRCEVVWSSTKHNISAKGPHTHFQVQQRRDNDFPIFCSHRQLGVIEPTMNLFL